MKYSCLAVGDVTVTLLVGFIPTLNENTAI